MLAIGTRLSETETGGYTLSDAARAEPGARARAPGRRRARPRLPPAARHRLVAAGVRGRRARARAASTAAAGPAGARPRAPTTRPRCASTRRPGTASTWPRSSTHLRERLPDAIVANGAGNYTVWVHRFWQFARYRSQLAPLSGAMGYGLPAAVAAKLVHPERPVVAFAGDGCFLMSAQELATTVANDLQILVIVVNNGMLGDDPHAPGAALPGPRRWHRPRQPRLRRVRAQLRRPRRAGRGARTEFAPALERALAAGGPALLELVCDPEALTPRQSLSRGACSGRAQRRELILVVAAAALADGRRQRPLELLAREVSA